MIDKRLLLDNVGTRGCKVKAGGKKEEEKEKEKWGVLTRDTPHRNERRNTRSLRNCAAATLHEKTRENF